MPLFEVRRGLGAGFGNNGTPAARMTTMGELVAVDFITAALLDGRGYQVRAGTIVTGLAADTPLADTAAEMCADAVAGTTIIPVHFGIAVTGVATATTLQIAVKAVGTVSSAGTAFTPLPLKQDGAAAVSTARVQATGAVTVTAELATTTRRLFEFTDVTTQTPTTIGNAQALVTVAASAADLRYIGVGPVCVYVQVASTTAQTLYFATLDYLEFPTLLVNPS